MGRGLSDLQKAILKLAYKNHVEENRPVPTYTIRVAERIPPYKEKRSEIRTYMKTIVDDRAEWDRWYDKEKQVEREAVDVAETRLCLKLAAIDASMPTSIKYDGVAYSNGWLVFTFESYPMKAAAMSRQTQLHTYGIRSWVEIDFGGQADVYTHEVLMEYFGFHAYRKTFMGGYAMPLRYNFTSAMGDFRGRRIPSGIFFDRAKIGHARYNAAQVAVTKAFNRLEQRRLVDCAVGGVSLTLEGVAVAEQLSANRSNTVTGISR